MLDNVYTAVGAATGAVKGVAEVGKKEAKSVTSTLTSRVFSILSQIQEAGSARAHNATTKLYTFAGALSGVVNGVKYAGLSIWWSLTDDEIKLKLLQGSPVKYKLKDLESLVQNHHNVGMALQYHHGQYNNGNGVAGPEVSLGAPVNSSNDHLAQHKQEGGVSRRSEDFSNSVDESLEAVVNKAASKSKMASSSHLHKKKTGVSATSVQQQQDEYSPRVLG